VAKTAAENEAAMEAAVASIERHLGYRLGGSSSGFSMGLDGGFHARDEASSEILGVNPSQPPRFSEFGVGDL
jgi:hypothetical protein